MHREYHPDDLRPFRSDGMTAPEETQHGPRGMAGLTAWCVLLGGLLLLQATLDATGAGIAALGWGLSPVRLAAFLGAARMVYLALEALSRRSVGADVALALASVAALVVGENFVAAEVVLIALVGELLEAWTSHRALRAIGQAFDRAPRVARVRRGEDLVEVPAHQVEVGETVVVAPGERIPIDGEILSGRTSVDESALTGESIPVDREEGDPVAAGTLNQFGSIEVRARKVGADTTLGQVVRLVSEAQRRKSQWQRTADRLARWFLPVVLGATGLTLLTGWGLGWPDTWSRAVAILVVACPCALILATPAAIMASFAWMARHGIVAKGGAAVERLATCDTLALDKTGTLTRGRPALMELRPLGGRSESALLELAATAEQASQHPLALAIAEAAHAREIGPLVVSESTALPGAGVAARRADDGIEILVGNRALLAGRRIDLAGEPLDFLERFDESGLTSLVVVEGTEVAGLIGLSDEIRPEAHDVVRAIKGLGFQDLAILTGDRPRPAERVGRRVHVGQVVAELAPGDKAQWIRERQASGKSVLFVGDGINDGPALAAADVGIAIGGRGSDLAAEAGDLVLLGEPLRKLPDLIRLSRATVRVLRQNIIGFAFGLNGVAIALAALGILGPVAAAILHQLGSLLVILNSMRLLGFGGWSESPLSRWLHRAEHALEHWDDRFDLGPWIEAGLTHWRAIATAGIALGLCGYSLSGWTWIGHDEVGLVRRLGRFQAVLEPGAHLRWPVPIETTTRVEPARVQSVEVGFRTAGGEEGAVGWESAHGREVGVSSEDEALMMTADAQLVEVTAAVQYRWPEQTRDLPRVAFEVHSIESVVRGLAETSLREVVSRESLANLLTTGRDAASRAVRASLGRRLEAAGLPVVVLAVSLEDVHPPTLVVDAYRDVSRAEKDRRAKERNAQSRAASTSADARAQAFTRVARARASSEGDMALAKAEAGVFTLWESVRRRDPSSTDSRLFVERSATALLGKEKLVLDQAAPGQKRHWIISDPRVDATSRRLLEALPPAGPP